MNEKTNLEVLYSVGNKDVQDTYPQILMEVAEVNRKE